MSKNAETLDWSHFHATKARVSEANKVLGAPRDIKVLWNSQLKYLKRGKRHSRSCDKFCVSIITKTAKVSYYEESFLDGSVQSQAFFSHEREKRARRVSFFLLFSNLCIPFTMCIFLKFIRCLMSLFSNKAHGRLPVRIIVKEQITQWEVAIELFSDNKSALWSILGLADSLNFPFVIYPPSVIFRTVVSYKRTACFLRNYSSSILHRKLNTLRRYTD